MNNELEKVWKEVIVDSFEVLSRHLATGALLNLRIDGLRGEV